MTNTKLVLAFVGIAVISLGLSLAFYLGLAYGIKKIFGF
jgi:hypothetical protein